MKVSGTHLLHAPPERVWEALRDPAVLAGAIPGCQECEAVSADEYRARVRSRVAAIDGVYDVHITLSDPQPVASCTVRVAASGDPGAVDATVVLRLDDGGDGSTHVHYDADVAVEGAIAGVGQRVLVGVARRNAAELFAAVDRYLAGAARPAAATPGAAANEPQIESPPLEHPGDGRLIYTPGSVPASRPRHLLLAALAGAAVALLAVLVGRRRS